MEWSLAIVALTLLGPDFRLVDARREEHLTPSGAVQPFSWITVRALSADGEGQP